MVYAEEIPALPDRSKRISEVTVDCYDQAEELSGFEVYLTDAMQFPFEAVWRDPDQEGHGEPVTVLGVASVDDRRGVLLSVRRGQTQRRLLAEQVWAKESPSGDRRTANAIVLDDYRYWVEEMNGLAPGYG